MAVAPEDLPGLRGHGQDPCSGREPGEAGVQAVRRDEGSAPVRREEGGAVISGPGESVSPWAAEQAERMLGALRYAWGEAYRIWHADDGRWMAVRLDGLGEAIEALGPEELGQAIFEDYSLKPVSRDLPGRKAGE